MVNGYYFGIECKIWVSTEKVTVVELTWPNVSPLLPSQMSDDLQLITTDNMTLACSKEFNGMSHEGNLLSREYLGSGGDYRENLTKTLEIEIMGGNLNSSGRECVSERTNFDTAIDCNDVEMVADSLEEQNDSLEPRKRF
ncbi:hypothetical protein COLO4_28435 [Corchorus olitorius]|uniref:Uncharacterized protein n=1 Tax=Corchorus olitorius TaxID=93759 RepID=A0A1R3HKP8_9ROSI|nr:hypothetical protein COLO4_28435 [Corchorus olitorius]